MAPALPTLTSLPNLFCCHFFYTSLLRFSMLQVCSLLLINHCLLPQMAAQSLTSGTQYIFTERVNFGIFPHLALGHESVIVDLNFQCHFRPKIKKHHPVVFSKVLALPIYCHVLRVNGLSGPASFLALSWPAYYFWQSPSEVPFQMVNYLGMHPVYGDLVLPGRGSKEVLPVGSQPSR